MFGTTTLDRAIYISDPKFDLSKSIDKFTDARNLLAAICLLEFFDANPDHPRLGLFKVKMKLRDNRPTKYKITFEALK